MSENEERTDIDRLVSKLVLSDDVKVKSEIFDKILQQAEERGIFRFHSSFLSCTGQR